MNKLWSPNLWDR